MKKMTVGEFIRETYIKTGAVDEPELRSAGFGKILDDDAVIDDEAATRLSERLGRSAGSWKRMYQLSL